jgi:hypothetical protein
MAEWNQIPYLGMLVEFARAAEERGILIVLVSSRISEYADAGSPEEGLWYNSEVSEARVLDSWMSLAQMFCGTWNVIGVDLQNEVRLAASHCAR